MMSWSNEAKASRPPSHAVFFLAAREARRSTSTRSVSAGIRGYTTIELRFCGAGLTLMSLIMR